MAKEAFPNEPWEIVVNEETIETTVCGPIKVRYRRTQDVSDDERDANLAAMEAEAMAIANLIVAAPAMHKALTLIADKLDQPMAQVTNESWFIEEAKTVGDLIRGAIKDIE